MTWRLYHRHWGEGGMGGAGGQVVEKLSIPGDGSMRLHIVLAKYDNSYLPTMEEVNLSISIAFLCFSCWDLAGGAEPALLWSLVVLLSTASLSVVFVRFFAQIVHCAAQWVAVAPAGSEVGIWRGSFSARTSAVLLGWQSRHGI